MPEPKMVMTIEDDDDVPLEADSDDEEAVAQKPKKKAAKSKAKAKANESFNKDFVFRADETGLSNGTWDMDGATRQLDQRQSFHLTSIDEKIERRRALKDSDDEAASEDEEDKLEPTEAGSDGEPEDKRSTLAQEKHGAYADTESEEESDDEGSGDDMDVAVGDEPVDPDAEKERKKQAFFHKVDTVDALSFQDMNLSRPLLRAVTEMGYVNPTPIQGRAIPVALLAKDICACANTGSGKTAAFMLPVLERLLYRSKSNPTTRVLVMSPTRELAAQCYAVATKLAQFTDITFSLVVGGLSDKKQAVELRHSPDIVIATPGRLIDHIHNTQSFDLQGIEILIMDEADRLLEMGFQDEVNEIVKNCPKGRQTMLFSATMTDEVDDLVSLSLHEPVRLFIARNTEIASNLVQEFVRIRQTREVDRDAFLLALCKRTYKTKCIVFFRSKAAAHRMKIIFGLMGLNAAELHGNLTQTQRLESLDKFRHGEVDFLLATDLAGRGLDIQGVEVVINFTMPHNLTQYIHRVGRTARAGKKGTAVTLVGEAERKLLKEIVKNAKDVPKSRVVPPGIIERYREKIESMASDIKAIVQQEKEERMMEVAERDVTKAQNLITYEKEIFSRPAKQWFQSEKDKKQMEELGKRAYEGEDVAAEASGKLKKAKTDAEEGAEHPALLEGVKATNAEKQARTRKQKRALAAKLQDDNTNMGAIKKAARDAKKASRKPRIHVHTPDREEVKKPGAKKVKKAGFEKELTDTSKRALKGSKSTKQDKTSKKDDRIAASKMALDKKLRVKELRKTKSVKAFKSKNRYKRK